MATNLVIVESPTKAKTIERFLGPDYQVRASVGHIRDLPANAAEVPAAFKGEPWASMGVDVDNGFKPLYVINRDKKDQVRQLKQLVAEASAVWLATDEDREGEAIAWHLKEVLAPRVPVRRMVFHEITQSAIQQALANPRDLDERLVDAQEARRILDRLFGYEVSPVLWKKVNPGLSAGRVQSVATRIVVERERERMAFRSASWWSVAAVLRPREPVAGDLAETLTASLVGFEGRRVATGRDFSSEGAVSRPDVLVLHEPAARDIATGLEQASYAVAGVENKPYRRKPPAPFATSSLQQEAGRKLRFSAQRTMQVAQKLYENGHITYMRTDSVTLSETALAATRAEIAALFGNDYLPAEPRLHKSKVKNAQEAHEAIRPAGERFRKPESLRNELNRDEQALYELIWQRTLASQMTDALGQTVAIRIEATLPDQRRGELAARGTTLTHPGFLRAYVEGSDDPDAELEDREVVLPRVAQGDALLADSAAAEGHETQPPARYSEAALVRRLEELGVGRPSTYASIISTIIARGYVWKKGSALVPSFTAFAVTTLLERHFGDLVDYAFTARMEDELDEIATGQAEALPYLERFYFGSDGTGLKTKVSQRLDEIDAAAINSIPLGVDAEGTPVVVRVGRYGPYLQRGDAKASIPDDLAPDELTIERAVELLEKGSDDRVVGTDPATGLEVIARNGRFGPYVQLGKSDEGKPQATSSLLPGMTVDSVTLEQALALLELPKVLGKHPEDGAEVVLLNGRYGPYVTHGKETRSLPEPAAVLSFTLEDALALLAQPKRGRGQAAAAGPLREVGTDPVSGQPITVREGRFGLYVSDGEVNATLQKGDTVEGITVERAAELLAARRERIAAGGGKKPARRAAAKKTTKKTTKKAAPRKRT